MSRVCCINKQVIEGSPKVFFESKFLRDLRQDFLEDRKPSSCNDCWRLEAEGYESIRTLIYKEFPIKKRNLRVDTDIGIQWLELRASNTCNFSCRMCGPNESSSIITAIT